MNTAHSEPAGAAAQLGVSERTIIFLIASVQFISVLEFMIVMPLGPDFAKELGIGVSHLGIIGGSYTGAAAISGLVTAMFIERFDRRSALATAMFLLVISTAAAGFATNLATLIAARVAAGLFGGPAMSLALAIIADTIPAERRGRAMGAVMASFSLASVLGIPAGLELARLGGWRLPFFAIGALGVIVAGTAIFKLPPLRLHLDGAGRSKTLSSVRTLLRSPMVRTALLMAFLLMTGMFMVIPNISAYVQANMHYPRESMGTLYLCGGLISFALMRFVGKAVDRIGAVPVATFGSVWFALVLTMWFLFSPPTWTVLPLFVAMMVGSNFRNVPYQTLGSQVPLPHERARYMSLQSSVQHIATTAGAFIASFMLSEDSSGALVGMTPVASVSILLCMTLPFLLARVQRGVTLRRSLDAQA